MGILWRRVNKKRPGGFKPPGQVTRRKIYNRSIQLYVPGADTSSPIFLYDLFEMHPDGELADAHLVA
jgi:hypothetical protein